MKERKIQRKNHIHFFRNAGEVMVGLFCGLWLGIHLVYVTGREIDTAGWLCSFGVLLISMHVSKYYCALVYGGGRMLGGLLSGYRVLSVHMGTCQWLRRSEHDILTAYRVPRKAKTIRYDMIPPQWKNDRIPIWLFFTGGVLASFACAVLFLVLYWLTVKGIIIPALCIGMIVREIEYILVHVIPWKTGAVSSDVYKAKYLSRTAGRLHSYWTFLKVREQLTYGKRMKDMPSEWFSVNTLDEGKDSTEEIKDQFYRISAVYPYPGEMVSERELMKLADMRMETLECQ